ncbi:MULTISPECIES: ABC transporter ATP-binding protein [Streptomyces violaceusniger group]|uniref:ATP-binding cassette domain-containing protein n=2 Tax=Streptomyces violaceusniger group TaxID=2839105 RepID=A0ABD5JMH1_9ACTN|nr:ATP-binding cassette domain-containing protein [Streptomyces violaceusniger]KUL45609.1 ABC transporter ATP-binding protein [Streptomyces violaceusniger]MEE4588951.1 ATP-binding cassette domain-containing protein [Streptomyces sp. DSM 41602]
MTDLVLENVHVRYGSGSSAHDAVRDVSLTVASGRTVGLVGESGSGKSTLARAVVGLHEPYAGRILVGGTDVVRARGRVAAARRDVQMIFQDASSSLDPRMTVGASVEEALEVRGFAQRDQQGRERTVRGRAGRRAEVVRLLETVELDPARANDLPSQLSGGQRQRVAIARALAASPRVLLADEITSALDVSVQGTVLNLLRKVQQELDLTVLFISHNLAVVRQLCDEVAVMKDGRVVETGPTTRVIDAPEHSYTRELIRAVPRFAGSLVDTPSLHRGAAS